VRVRKLKKVILKEEELKHKKNNARENKECEKNGWRRGK
jgi:hypothetical protein